MQTFLFHLMSKDLCPFGYRCSSSVISQLRCPDGENTRILCIRGKNWYPNPACTCPNPLVRDDLVIQGNCTSKGAGSACRVSCRDNTSISSHHHIICQKNMTWTSQPSCSKGHCSEPQVPSFLTTKGACNGTVGSICKVACKGSRQVIGQNLLACLDTLHWSPFPLCTCEEPDMGSELQSGKSCRDIPPGQTCELKCKGHLKVHGTPTIRCLKNATWSHLPKCIPRHCSDPRIPSHLIASEACSKKQVGDTCAVSCRDGGEVIGNGVIVCLNETHWSDDPICTCPKPDLNQNLKSLTECNSVSPGNRCYLKCEDGSQITEQNNYIVCRNDSKWSEQPVCEMKTCPQPSLSSALKIDKDDWSNCSSKKPGDTCKLACSKGGNIVGISTITCLSSLIWSDFPTCTCPLPKLNSDIKTVGSCSDKTVGEQCRLTCKNSSNVISFPTITCKNDSTWGSQPRCNKNFCDKPQLKPHVIAEEACLYKLPGETCSVSCGAGGEIRGSPIIRCTSKSNWNHQPDCGCPYPILTEDIQTRNNCSQRPTGSKCYVECKDTQKLARPSNFICLDNLTWSANPRCIVDTSLCNRPILKEGIEEASESCVSKKVGQNCSLRCADGGKVVGSDTIKCLNRTHWSTQPECACPVPELPRDLELTEGDCSSKIKNQICKVKCKSPSMKLVGNDLITCDAKMKWSSFPRCQVQACPEPDLLPRGVLRFVSSCKSVQPGKTCELACVRGRMIGDKMKCMDGKTWSKQPDCACKAPVLSASLTTTGNCSSKKRNEVCTLTCKDNKKVKGLGYIVCQDNMEWSDPPTCEEQFCPEPRIPKHLKNVTSCSSKISGDSCELNCLRGTVVVGEEKIVCLRNLSWTAFPTCSCPQLNLLTGLIGKNCTAVKPGERCVISCRDNFSRPESDFISCDKNSKWESIPECKRARCPDTSFSQSIMYRGECPENVAGEICQINCIGKGQFLNNDSHIRCNINGSWTHPRVCVCPPPRASHSYILKDICNFIRANQTCPVSCANKFDAEKPQRYITCDSTYHWANYPPCQIDACPAVILSHHLAVVSGTCHQLKTGESCKLSCNKGKMSGPEVVSCDENKMLSPVPKCVCPKPNYPPYILPNERVPCEGKSVGEGCSWYCKQSPTIISYIQCTEDLNWTEFRECPCLPPPLHANVYLESTCREIKQFNVGGKCQVACLYEHAVLIGDSTLECKSGNKWSPSPYCVCPPVTNRPDLDTTQCRFVMIGKSCTVNCLNGGVISRPYAGCNDTYHWDLPTCRLDCSDPKAWLQGALLVLREDCSAKTKFPSGTSCTVICTNGGRYITKPTVDCRDNGMWTELPQCSCPPPALPVPYKVAADCSQVFHGQPCPLDLEPDYQFHTPENRFIYCTAGRWSTLPPIIDRFCKQPEAMDALVIIPPDCQKLQLNGFCNLKCAAGGKFWQVGGTDFRVTCIRHQETGVLVWNYSPVCTCVLPVRSQPICQDLKLGESCSMTCPSGLIISVKCLTTGYFEYPRC